MVAVLCFFSARHACDLMMSGIVSRPVEMENSYPAMGPITHGRRIASGRQSPTAPLKIFGLAKKRINDIFVDISSYIDESSTFLKGLCWSSLLSCCLLSFVGFHDQVDSWYCFSMCI
jgi:hypothetical protein